jgi:Uma2 family endonuclease
MATIVAPKLTYRDLQAMPNDGKRYELIDGEVYMTPSPNRKHQEAVGNLYTALRAFASKGSLGKVYLAPFDVVLDERNVLQPDLLFVRQPRLAVVEETHVAGAPDLVVEVLSRGTASYDRETKLQLYARAGVSEVWLVDPDARTVEVLNLGSDSRYVLTARLAGEATIPSAVLPGLALTMHEVFAS